MSNARRAVPSLKFNGKNVTTKLADYLESISYEDVASGGSDVLTIQLQNIDFKWMSGWYPAKGDKVSGSVKFKNWEKDGADISCSLGAFTLDEIKFSGGPLTASFGCLSAPANESFKTRERTKTWKKVTVQQIANEVAKRYSLSLSYTAPTIKITSLEQSQKSDCTFLSDVCDTYGLSMKIYKSKIVIYDQVQQEKKKAVGKLARASFVDDSWEFVDALQGVYTGARVTYKSGKKSSDEISVFSGYKAEDAKGSRVLRVNQTCDSKDEAYLKAAVEVNKSNRKATTLSGDIWPNPKYCAGVNVTISGMGKANGKYFIDKSTLEITDSGTKQHLEMHKVQVALST